MRQGVKKIIIMNISGVLIESFEKWLTVMGYADSTVYGSSLYVRDFFDWLRPTPIEDISQIDSKVLKSYHEYLQKRKNKRKTGSLSNNYIISNINALKRFSRYLQESGQGILEIDLKVKAVPVATRAILTRQEVKDMYRACKAEEKDLAGTLGIRDRALLSIYYGCGLRRSEGTALNVADVQLKEKLVYVRKGKNYRERYVPMSETVKDDLESYIKTSREKILSYKNMVSEALFISLQGKRLGGNQVIERIHELVKAAGIEKDIGLHSLRHSIATHLLQAGMTLEEVSQFLGHGSLESTQIYTHIVHEQTP